MADTPKGFKNITTTRQVAFVTKKGNVQVRKIRDTLWEILPPREAVRYETSRKAALDTALGISFSMELGARKAAKTRARKTSRARK